MLRKANFFLLARWQGDNNRSGVQSFPPWSPPPHKAMEGRAVGCQSCDIQARGCLPHCPSIQREVFREANQSPFLLTGIGLRFPDMGHAITVHHASWDKDAEAIRKIRTEVFVIEQKVPLELEIDGADPVSRHVLALEPDGSPIGTARLLETGQIGRIAVLRAWRGQGIGSQMVASLVALARSEGSRSVTLHAQVQAVSFYEKLGFHDTGEPPFDDAGIQHVHMERKVTEDGS